MENIAIEPGGVGDFLIKGEVTISIEITNNWLYVGLEHYDSFCFITNGGKLLEISDLIFYNNSQDNRAIVTEINDSDVSKGDIELKLNLTDNTIRFEAIEIYLKMSFLNHQSKFSSLFKIQKEKEIVLEFTIYNHLGIAILKGKTKNILTKIMKLLTIRKIHHDVAEIHFCNESFNLNIEDIIELKLEKI